MSDYTYLLESLLSREQSNLLSEVQKAAAEAGVAIYLTGGAMRDMLGGFPIRDLDFTFETDVLGKLCTLLSAKIPELEIQQDPIYKSAELKLPTGVTGSLRMARVVKTGKAGAHKILPVHLLEDLAHRDFTFNAIAFSLARASKGLLRDPMNGVADLEHREVRVCYSHAFIDNPKRMLRAIRFRHRLGFQLEVRTQRYFASAVEEGLIKSLTAADWQAELMRISEENEPSQILRELDASHLLPYSAESLNLDGLAKFETVRRTVPGRGSYWTLFLSVLTQTLKAKDRASFGAAFGLKPADLEAGKKIKTEAAKLSEALKAPALKKPSQIYHAVSAVDPAELVYVLYEDVAPIVQERLQKYLDEYLPMAGEVTDAQVEATGVKIGSKGFAKAKATLITNKLNAPPPPPPEPEPVRTMGRPAPTVR